MWGQILSTDLENSSNNNVNELYENIDLVWKIGSMCEAYVYEKCVRNIKEVILTTKLENI